MLAKDVEVHLPRCAAWRATGVTIAGGEDARPSAALDGLHGPTGLHVTRDGTMYVADQQNDRVMKYSLDSGRTGVRIGDGRGSGSRQLHGPNSVVVHEETNAVYISDGENHRIQEWRNGGMDTSVATVLGKREQNGSEEEVYFATNDVQMSPRASGILYILDTLNRRVRKWRLGTSHYLSEILVTSRSLGIHLDAQENLYVAGCGGHEIYAWPGGRRVAGRGLSGDALNRLNCPSAVVVDSDGGMFIADTNNHRIMRWEPHAPQGICIVGCSEPLNRGNGSDQLGEPKDVIFDLKGNLLVADTGNHRVQRFDLFVNAECRKYILQ